MNGKGLGIVANYRSKIDIKKCIIYLCTGIFFVCRGEGSRFWLVGTSFHCIINYRGFCEYLIVILSTFFGRNVGALSAAITFARHTKMKLKHY